MCYHGCQVGFVHEGSVLVGEAWQVPTNFAYTYFQHASMQHDELGGKRWMARIVSRHMRALQLCTEPGWKWRSAEIVQIEIQQAAFLKAAHTVDR